MQVLVPGYGYSQAGYLVFWDLLYRSTASRRQNTWSMPAVLHCISHVRDDIGHRLLIFESIDISPQSVHGSSAFCKPKLLTRLAGFSSD